MYPLTHFNIFITDLEKATKCALRRFADTPNWGGWSVHLRARLLFRGTGAEGIG